jgi:hypothetical protein
MCPIKVRRYVVMQSQIVHFIMGRASISTKKWQTHKAHAALGNQPKAHVLSENSIL